MKPLAEGATARSTGIAVLATLMLAGTRSCTRDITSPAGAARLATAPPTALDAPNLADTPRDSLGIGGVFEMPASGPSISTVDLQPTGIIVPRGTAVRVDVAGAIARQQTPGVKQFCALERYARLCATA